MNEAQQVTPAGWYDDGQGHQRWWDGTNWGPIAPPTVRRAYSGIAIAGFVITMVALGTAFFPAFVLSIVLLVLGFIFTGAGLIDTRNNSKRGRGLAAAGFIISAPLVAFVIIASVIS